MNSLSIQSSTHHYDVIIGEGIRHQLNEVLTKDYQTVLIITDDQVAKLYLQDVCKALAYTTNVQTAIVPAGEASKSMKYYEQLLNECVQAQLDRHSLIIGLGGGMTGDLAGFVASTYLRGIDFIQMPTTILAHDSSVGGKVAINHPQGKNLIGSFYNPTQVIYDIQTLTSLSEVEIRSGYGEVVKHAFLSDSSWLQELLSGSLSSISQEQLATDLTKGINVKANIVEQDEQEKGIRKYLNFGHTLAHAIEAELGYGGMTHGEAVAIGMLFAIQLSNRRLGSDLPVEDYVNWMNENNYPLHSVANIDPDRIVKRMKHDKKTIHNVLNFVLLKEIGSPCVEKVSDKEVVKELEYFKEVIQFD